MELAFSAMDRVDQAIIGHLMRDGRLANTDLADRVGLSPSPCLRRVRSLERDGVITGYHAAVDLAAIGRGFEVLLHVEMAVQDRATLEAFEAEIAQISEITECRRMFGHRDYLLWIATADLEAYERLYMARLVGLPGVARTNSQFTMKTVKKSITGLPGTPG
jgi:Lrp/AsnC family leucine-responsive transcriptional regulator